MEIKNDVKSSIQIDIKQFTTGEQAIYHAINAIRNPSEKRDPNFKPNLDSVNLTKFVLKQRSGWVTYLQEKIYQQILLELETDAKSGDFDALFKGYTVSMHRTLQRHYYEIYDIFTILHPIIKDRENSINNPLGPFSDLFLQLIDLELLFALQALSLTYVLSKSKMQDILEQNVHHYIVQQRKFDKTDQGTWIIHPAVTYQARDAFIAEQEKYPALLLVIQKDKEEYEREQLALHRARSDQGVMQLRLEEDKRKFAVEQEQYASDRATLMREQDQLRLEREKFNEENTPYQRIKQLGEENALLRANVGCMPSSWFGFGMFSTRQKSTATTKSATLNMAIM